MDALDRFAAGDLDAFETVFRQYQGEVHAWIARIVRNPAAAEDLTLETFWRVYRYRKRFDPRRPFGPWARRIATRLALDYLRTSDRLLLESYTASIDPSGPDVVAERELQAQVQSAFRSLPARLRVAATLALIEEQPYAEIAAALDISLSAVKMRVRRAVRRLRKNLEEMGIHR